MGMEHTNFVTASGLDADEHYSTALDMAKLGAAAIQNEDFLAICSNAKYGYICKSSSDTELLQS